MAIKKNKGPLLTSVYNGIIDLVPPRWRSKVGLKRTTQEVPVDVPPDDLVAPLVSSQVVQERTDERLKTNWTIGDFEDKVMIEYVRTKDGQIATKEIRYVPEGTPLPTMDELTIDATQEASGNGFSEQVITKVPNLFGAADYSVELRDVIPPEFAALLQTREEAVTVAGIAALPVLAIGDLRREEQQLTEQTKRVSRRYRDTLSLPVTITEYETNKEKQFVTVTKTLQLDTVPPIQPTALTDSEYSDLGNGMAVQTIRSVPSLYVGAVYGISIVNLIPERFRAFVPISRHEYNATGPVNATPVLGPGELSHTESQYDEFNKRVETSGLGVVSVPVTFVRYETNDKKQVVTVTETLQLDTVPPLLPTATRDSDYVPLGNGYAIQTTREVPNVFVGAVYGKSIINLIPERFRAGVPTHRHEYTVTGAVVPDPVLATGELSHTETQTDEFNKRVESIYIDATAIPVSFTSYETNDKKQVVTVTDTLELDTVTPLTPTAVRDTEFKPLGNGMAVQTSRTIPNVFVGVVYGKSIVNLIPERFRAGVPTRRHDFTTTGAVVPDPVFATGELSHTETQVDEFNKRVESVYIDATTVPVVLTSYETNDKKQVVEVKDTLDLDSVTPPLPTAVKDTEFKPLGNGLAVISERSVPGVFVGVVYSKSIVNLIPERFRAGVPTRRHEFTTTGAVVPDPPFAVGELSHTETQTDEFNKRVESTYVDATGVPVSFTSYETNDKKQVVEVKDTLDLDSVTPPLPTAVKDTEFKPLGNGLAVISERTIPGVFVGAVYAKTITNLIPERFRAAVPTRRHEFTTTGAVVPDPTFATGELSHTETQTDEFNKRVESVYIDAVGIPVTQVSYETNDKKQVVTVTDKLELDTETPLLPTEVRDAEFRPLGNGLAIQTTRDIPGIFVGVVYAKSIVNLIPERFRAGVPTRRHDYTTTGAVVPDPPFATGELSHTETQVDVFNKRVESVYVDATGIPVTFTSYETNDKKQVVTVTDKLELDTVTPLLPTAIRDAEFKPLGNGLAVQTTRDIPSIFVGVMYEASKLNLIPERFRAFIKTRRHEYFETGAVNTDPPLTLGDLRRTETQTDEFNKRVQIEYVDPTDVPQQLVSKDTNKEKQVVTITDQLVLDTEIPELPTAVRDTKFQPLGNGLAVQTLTDIDAIFVGAVYAKSITNLIPERFRAGVPTRRHEFTTTGAVVPDPAFATGELSHTETQTDMFNKRVESVYIDATAIPVTFTSYETNDKKQVVTVTDKLELDTTTPLLPTAVRDAEFKPLGNGLAVQTTRDIPNVFVGAVYSKSIVNLIPERFRAGVPTRRDEYTTTGSVVVDPPFATGELTHTETQVDEFNKRVESIYIDATDVPVTFTSYETNDKKQVVTVVDKLELDTEIPLLPTAVRDTEFKPLGNGLAVQTSRTIPNVFVGAVYGKSITNLIPERFRAGVPTRRHDFTTTGAVVPDPTFATGELSHTETQIDEFNKRVESVYVDATGVPVSFTSYETNDKKQVVTVTDTLELDTETPLLPTAVRDTEFKPLGNGLAVQTSRTIPNVFVGVVYAKSIVNLIPERFRAGVPTRRHDYTTTGAVVADPAFATGELSHTETQIDEFNKRVESVYVDATGTVTFTSYETNDKKQVVTVTDTLELDTVPPLLPTAVRDTEFKPLGNGLAVQTSRTIPNVFVGVVYAKSIVNLIPERFRGGVPTRRHDFTTTGAVVPDPAFGTGELSHTETQIDEFNKRIESVYVDATGLPITFQSFETNDKKQVVTVNDTLELDTETPIPPSPISDTEFRPLGNGLAVQTTKSLDGIFIGAVYGKSIVNLIPERFKAAVPTRKHDFTTVGAVVPDPTFGTGELSHTETQIDEFNKRVESVYVDSTSVPQNFVSKDTNKEKQVVTITDTLDLVSVLPPAPTALQSVKFQPLGNGMAVTTIEAVDAIFVGAVYGKSIANLIPEKLRAAVPQRKHDFTTTGAVVPDPTLTSGELSHIETQIDEFNKRVESTSIDTVSGTTVADKVVATEFGGAVATRTAQLATHGTVTVPTGKMVLKSELTNLNNGWDVLETVVADDAAWPSLQGQDYDERFDVLIPFTKQVKDANTDLGVAHTEVKPIDRWREESRQIDISAVAAFLDTYALSYFGRVNVDLPDKLVSLQSYMNGEQQTGASSETGTFAGTGSFSVQQGLIATAQSSTIKVPEVIAVIKQFWGNNIPCTNYHFFLPSPVTPTDVMTKLQTLIGGSVSNWPKYNPEMLSLVIVGGKVNVQAKASSSGSLSQSTSGNSSTAAGGTGYSRDEQISVKSMRISPTIHAAITVGGTVNASDTVSATATAEATSLGPHETITQDGTINANVTPTSIPATVGDTDWPTTGKFVYRVDAQPYRFGYIQIHCVVVDAADFPTGSGGGGGGGGGPFIMKANMSVDDAYGTADFLTDLTEAWVTFEVRMDLAAATYLDTGGGNVDFVNLQASDTSTRNSVGISDFTANQWFVWREGAGHVDVGVNSAHDVWITVELHFKVSNVSEVYLNSVLMGTTPAGSANAFRKVNFGAFWGTPNAAAIFYLRNFKVGSTRGGSDHFFDDLASGDFSNWNTAPTGNCTVVPDPF